MRLYLIRHAQSTNNAIYTGEDAYPGHDPDPEITETGHKQAQKLGELMASSTAEPRRSLVESTLPPAFGLTHLYCSLMTRTLLTARYIAQACQLPLTALGNTFERGGIYDVGEDGAVSGAAGPGRSYFAQRFPHVQIPAEVSEAGWYQRPFETLDMFVPRVRQVVAELKERHGNTDDRVALVAHGDFIDQFVNEVLAVPRHNQNYASSWVQNWVTHNTSVTRFDFAQEAQGVLIYLNRIDHLSADLITW